MHIHTYVQILSILIISQKVICRLSHSIYLLSRWGNYSLVVEVFWVSNQLWVKNKNKKLLTSDTIRFLGLTCFSWGLLKSIVTWGDQLQWREIFLFVSSFYFSTFLERSFGENENFEMRCTVQEGWWKAFEDKQGKGVRWVWRTV